MLANKDWHSGVLGIVASRTVDKFYRPTIMINTASEDGTAQGSGRSIPGFCLLSAIKACSQYLQNFGGHEMAAGITIKPEKIERFAAEFETYASENLNADDVVATLDIDAHLFLPETAETATFGIRDQRRYRTGEMAYDRERGFLYFFEPFADGAKPVVHVWAIRH